MDFIRILVLLVGVAIAVLFDIRFRMIPNKLTFPGIMIGIILFAIENGFSGILISLLGLIVGVFILIIPFSTGGIGAGDVKMLGAIGSIMGARFVLETAILAAVSGGIIALFYLFYKIGFIGTMQKLFGTMLTKIFRYIYVKTGIAWFDKKSILLNQSSIGSMNYYIPYAIPIAIGVILAYFGFLS